MGLRMLVECPMGKGGEQGEASGERVAQQATYTWLEIQHHNLRANKWLVIKRRVYISRWFKRHPGSLCVISHGKMTPRQTKPGHSGSGAALLVASSSLKEFQKAPRGLKRFLQPQNASNRFEAIRGTLV